MTDDTREAFAHDPGVRTYECADVRREPSDPARPDQYCFVGTGCAGPSAEVIVP